MTDLTDVTVGFLPLLDGALLIAAAEKGFAEEEGLSLTLVRETSWASIRDRMAVGHFDAAHMLAPMPIASNLGLTPLNVDMIVPLALGLGGNAITVSAKLHDDMKAYGLASVIEPSLAGAALRAVIGERSKAGLPLLRFAVVHPFSGHNYELRYWLAACGIAPDRDVEIVVVPPPLMADALKSGAIDGYCVGEPWNSVGVAKSGGHIITVKAAIWQASPEKVLGVEAGWAKRNPQTLEALVRSLVKAALWCGKPENHVELAEILSRTSYLGLEPALILPALDGRLQIGDGEANVPDFFIPYAKAATFPWISHGLWFYSQMVRWGHAEYALEIETVIRSCYRPDIYRKSVQPLGIAVPAASMKVEGALATPEYTGSTQGELLLGPDGFFDGRIFEPEKTEAYIEALKAHDQAL